MRFLAQPNDPKCLKKAYRETKHGAAALAGLDWNVVLAQPTFGRLTRSMFEDVALALGVALPMQGTAHPATKVPQPMLLRNV